MNILSHQTQTGRNQVLIQTVHNHHQTSRNLHQTGHNLHQTGRNHHQTGRNLQTVQFQNEYHQTKTGVLIQDNFSSSFLFNAINSSQKYHYLNNDYLLHLVHLLDI